MQHHRVFIKDCINYEKSGFLKEHRLTNHHMMQVSEIGFAVYSLPNETENKELQWFRNSAQK